MKSGIYKISNEINGKFYIGSSVDMDLRWKKHLRTLKNNQHRNIHLQRAFNKYGESAFTFSILIYCDPSQLNILEQNALDKWASSNECYNISEDSTARFRGKSLSSEHKKKISESLKGIKRGPLSTEHKKKLSESWDYDKHFTEETRKKLSDASKGRTLSPEHKEKIRVANVGKIPSDSTRELWSKQRKGRKVSSTTRKKLRAAAQKQWREGRGWSQRKAD